METKIICSELNCFKDLKMMKDNKEFMKKIQMVNIELMNIYQILLQYQKKMNLIL